MSRSAPGAMPRASDPQALGRFSEPLVEEIKLSWWFVWASAAQVRSKKIKTKDRSIISSLKIADQNSFCPSRNAMCQPTASPEPAQ
ncbi:hypothetical protein H8B02_42310 [Bradyrhizobium sp. Pear77]|uniref:hypothetical protein n=1 Tax=Bradyrhizobium altum TaxID=1571202 RepID=UPI001E30A2C4|nr:hypothetical protein [Bradyrhizobium altum]MCC8959808.1 hypothetical protein [Bradyrhizobium altum]